jgi:hypothetical protein
MPRIWTQEEIQILLESKKKRVKAQVQGRSETSIRRKSIELGLIKTKYKVKFQNKRPWTTEETNILLDAKDKFGVKLPHRTKSSILSKLVHLKLIERKEARKPWNRRQNRLLRKLVKEGKSARDIFLLNVLPFSRNSIQKKMCYCGLAKKLPPAQYLSKETTEIFKNFLINNWKGKTPEDLKNIWNERNSVKVCRRKVVYHLCMLKIKIPYVEVARINLLRKKEKNLRDTIISPKELAESLRIIRADMMEKRMLKNRDIWTGLPLTSNELAEIESDNW